MERITKSRRARQAQKRSDPKARQGIMDAPLVSPFGDIAARAGSKIKPDASGCWMWQGEPNTAGYGMFEYKPAHRWVWKLLRGPIAEDLVLHHTCGVKLCVNPDHLIPMTKSEHSTHHANERWKRERKEATA